MNNHTKFESAQSKLNKFRCHHCDGTGVLKDAKRGRIDKSGKFTTADDVIVASQPCYYCRASGITNGLVLRVDVVAIAADGMAGALVEITPTRR